MNSELLDQIVEAVLYEGYILYPYRASSKKNQQRFTFGRVYPQAYHDSQNGAESCTLLVQCLFERHPGTKLEISLRFLHPMMREVEEVTADGRRNVVTHLEVGGHRYQTWQESAERVVSLPLDLRSTTRTSTDITFPTSRESEEIHDNAGNLRAIIIRRQDAINGTLEVNVEALDEKVSRITALATNLTSVSASDLKTDDSVLMRTFASTHLVLHVEGGAFFSMTDPPAAYAKAAADCTNRGAWPVLVGDQAAGDRDTLLASPIILEDYPKIAPESAGSLYDGTEIDEILTLRIMTMTDEEKREMRSIDETARALLERTDSLGADHLMRMHGKMRGLPPKPEAIDPFDAYIFGSNSQKVSSATVNGVKVSPGDAVVVRPKARADAFDMMLAGKTAIIEALEEDAEGKIHVTVVIDDDPGRDLGLMRQPGHRFFYGLDEIEPLAGALS